jgi:hypothetical protein
LKKLPASVVTAEIKPPYQAAFFVKLSVAGVFNTAVHNSVEKGGWIGTSGLLRIISTACTELGAALSKPCF